MDLNDQATRSPNRVTPDIVHTLTRGVAEPRTQASRGAEGILGQDSATRAARTVANMSDADYRALRANLDNAGMRDGSRVRGSDPQAERALILESVAAREQQLTHRSAGDRLRNAAGLPSRAMVDVNQYAGDVRGMRRNELIDQSTVLDLRNDGRNSALQQRFEDTCVPTSAQIARSEADPIYARQLHQEAIHSIASNTSIGREQSRLLQAGGGGTGIARPGPPGAGLTDPATTTTMNNHVGPAVNRSFNYQFYPDSPPTAAGRQARRQALDRIETRLRQGHDVPIGVTWQGGGGHCMIMTDVRGHGDSRQFMLTDPYTGSTRWMAARDIIRGNNSWPAGRGVMDASWE
jgi:hypothetical protein